MKDFIIIYITIIATLLESCSNKPLNNVQFGNNYLQQSEKTLAPLRSLALEWYRLPKSTKDNQIIWCEDNDLTDWSKGFFPGCCWLMYEYFQKNEWKNAAEQLQALIKTNPNIYETYNTGLIFNVSFGNAYRLTQNNAYKDICIQAARHITQYYNPHIGCLSTPNMSPANWIHFKNWQYPVSINEMMNLELLFKATSFTLDSTFYHIAVSHADKTLENGFREDFSSYNIVDYDTTCYIPSIKQTEHGYADESAWSRGQAWGLYGYTTCYRYTHDKKYLQQAIRIAEYIIHKQQEIDDKIPFWDYNIPLTATQVPKDASAAAITASALIELSHYAKPEYKNYARQILNHLSGQPYSSPKNKFFILDHSTGSFPKNQDIDCPASYADYYYIEALIRLKG